MIQTVDPIGKPLFYISFTLPAGVPAATIIQITFVSNSDGYEEFGILVNDVNDYVLVSRRMTAVVPTAAPTRAPSDVSHHTA